MANVIVTGIYVCTYVYVWALMTPKTIDHKIAWKLPTHEIYDKMIFNLFRNWFQFGPKLMYHGTAFAIEHYMMSCAVRLQMLGLRQEGMIHNDSRN